MNCYNCGSPTHHSARCPEPQQYNRCPSCNAVATAQDRHKNGCENVNFVSRFIGVNSTVFETENIFGIDFKFVSDSFKVLDRLREYDIGSMPLWLSTIDAFVYKSGTRALDFATTRNSKKTVTIFNKNVVPVVSIVYQKDVIVVNQRYHFRSDGWVSYKYDVKDNANVVKAIVGPQDCRIKLENDGDEIKMRLRAWGHKFEFKLSINGAVFEDPVINLDQV